MGFDRVQRHGIARLGEIQEHLLRRRTDEGVAELHVQRQLDVVGVDDLLPGVVRVNAGFFEYVRRVLVDELEELVHDARFELLNASLL